MLNPSLFVFHVYASLISASNSMTCYWNQLTSIDLE